MTRGASRRSRTSRSTCAAPAWTRSRTTTAPTSSPGQGPATSPSAALTPTSSSSTTPTWSCPPAAYLEAAELALSSDRLVIGFSRYRPLSKARTVEAFAGSDPFTLDPVDELVDFSVGRVLAITPECWWAAGGMDERYVDWGCEDFAFADAAGAALGPVLRVDGPAVHLWHPHAGDPTNPDQQANSRLLAGGER